MSFIPKELKKEMEEKIDKIKKIKGKKKKYITPIWDRIKEKVKIPDLINLDSDNHCECPFKGNTPPNRSFVYYPETETWSCFHPECSGGNVIHLFQHLNNIPTYKEAIKTLAKQYDIPFGKIDEKYIETEKKIQDLFQDFTEKCHQNLLNNEYYELVKEKRDFTDDTMKMFRIGYFTDDIRDYMDSKYKNTLLHDAGFKNYSKKDKEKRGKLYWILRNDKIVYPYLNQNNQAHYFIYRKIDKEEKNKCHLKKEMSHGIKD